MNALYEVGVKLALAEAGLSPTSPEAPHTLEDLQKKVKKMKKPASPATNEKEAGFSDWVDKKNQELSSSGAMPFMMGQSMGKMQGATAPWQGGGSMMMGPSSYRR